MEYTFKSSIFYNFRAAAGFKNFIVFTNFKIKNYELTTFGARKS